MRGLNKSFDGKKVVENLSMQVRRGRIHGFLGPNGSGKTTTIRMLCGLLTPDSGQGTCLGYDILTQQREIKRRVGYMTQRFSLYADLTIRENLEFVARIYGLRDPAARAARGDRAARPWRARQPARRRIVRRLEAAARAWRLHPAAARSCCCSTSPPQASIPRRGAISGTRFTSSRMQGLTVLVSTHYMDEAERCHEIAYIADGQLLAQGTIAEIIAQSRLSTYVVTGDDLRDSAESG